MKAKLANARAKGRHGWQDCDIEPLQEALVLHAAKGGLRRRRTGGQLLLAACLPGERHEWGLIGSLALAQDLGWDIRYLGPDLPFEQVVQAAWSVRPMAVALSAADPVTVRQSLGDLKSLAERLPPRTFLVAGGRGMRGHHDELTRAGLRIELTGLGPPPQTETLH